MTIKNFLLVFDRRSRTLLREQDFNADAQAALLAYAQAENDYQDCPNIEIVLIGSDSLETVKLTHANYFEPLTSRSPYLAGI